MLSVDGAVVSQRPCYMDCHRTLTTAQRARAIETIYHCDDALRGWRYSPIYDIDGDRLWRDAQLRDDGSYRGVAVRFGECIYRRLVGSMIHEVLHASFGDTAKANYGIPFGAPYGVPKELPPRDEESYLAPLNFAEARAFVGVWILGAARFAVDWDVRTARDIGTYCFVGGNALVPVPSAYRAIAHIDPVHHETRYVPRGRKLEEEARAWFTDENVSRIIVAIDEAAARGRATRPKRYPDAAVVARITPHRIGRNDTCPCGSGKKVKACCGDRASVGQTMPYFAR